MKKYAVVLAAGKGTRMKSLDVNKPKSAYEIFGKPLISYVLDALSVANVDKTVVVIGVGGDEIKAIVNDRAETVVQKKINGTAKAVETASELLAKKKGSTIVACGDTPLIRGKTIEDLFEYHELNKFDMTIATMIVEDPTGYGRIVRGKKSEVLKIVEDKDASLQEKKILEVNSGLYVFNNQYLFEYLKHIKSNNNQKEYYLTDIVNLFNKNKKQVGAFVVNNQEEMFGINDRKQLAYAHKIIQKRVNEELMLSGVTIEDARTAYISPDVKIGQDTTIRPNTTILGNSEVGTNNIIGPNSYLKNVKIGNSNKIFSSWLENYSCNNNCEIGPFVKRTEKDSEIVNQIDNEDLKKSRIRKGNK